ncbi:conserved hypothetical protein [Flavobacterium sp. 9AF]|nr:class I lanthipeptide [Flavobacterium sp. 9AF]VXB33776.1 conserved hypothetical protein [Flavobacterium sp. 9AF]
MKKINLNKGLTLNKEAITKLQESQMSSLKGGAQEGAAASCVLLSCNKQQ